MSINNVLLIALLVFTPVSLASNSTTSAIIDLSQLMNTQQLLEKIADSRVVYVSESHTRYDHHLLQLQIIDHQHQRHDNLAIGLEFIQQPFQPVLDDFIAGRIDEEAMLRGTEYFQRWSYDYRLYRPIFQYAREHGIALIALNIDKAITDQAKAGGLESLDETQKAQLPSDIDRSDDSYRQRLREVFDQHPNHDDSDFAGFVEIQLLWDESMAERAASWLTQNPDGHLVVLAGTGHIIYGSGIPQRVQRRTAVSASRVILLDEDASIKPGMGDFVILSQHQELAPSGKLGVILDSQQSPPVIIDFAPQSGAGKAGVEKGDRIVRIGERQINSYFDIRMALLEQSAGQTVQLEVSRDGFFTTQQLHQFEVELQ